MTPGVFPLQIYRGDDQFWSFTCFDDTAQTVASSFTPGVSARAQVRDRPGGWLMCNLDCSLILPNVVQVHLRWQDSQFLPMQAAWDLRLSGYPDGSTQTILTGIVAVSPNVTEKREWPWR